MAHVYPPETIVFSNLRAFPYNRDPVLLFLCLLPPQSARRRPRRQPDRPTTRQFSAHRHGGGGGGHARHRPHSSSCKEDPSGVPFPLAPEVREDQSLPPTIPGHNGRKSRKGGDSGGKRVRGDRRRGKRTGANGGEGGRHQGGSGGESESGCLWDGGTDGSDRQEDDLDIRLKVSKIEALSLVCGKNHS